jgi:hypothetical protein
VPDQPGGKLAEARALLRALNFDAERSNERSALVLLALLALPEDATWAEASNPTLRTVEIMDLIRQHYGRDYKPNTRETIRRQTLHQFADVALVLQNPDAPDRPVNSPRWCYQVNPRALEVFQAYGKDSFDDVLRRYLTEVPNLIDSYAVERQMRRIPVTLPGGRDIRLSSGGQNELLQEMIDDFCGYFTPGGQVLYVGDADQKWMHVEQQAFARLGIRIDEHGKMPDLVVYLPDKQWLVVLLEAASSHGPVDAKRHGELKNLFAAQANRLVFVSCFPTRVEMRRYLAVIAWETEAWCADEPTHIVHFNGERFLGPYPTDRAG